MTTEKAINLIERISCSQHDAEKKEALDMAVMALFSQQTVNDSQGLVNDCISRQQAIDAFEPEYDTDWYTPQIIKVLEALPPVQPTQTNADSTHENTLDCVSRQQAIDMIKKEILERDGRFYKGLLVANHVIVHLPPAQPHWIPCSERLPEANGRYFVTRGLNACGAMWNRVYIINYSDLMGIKSERMWWGGNVGKSDFERIDDVIAWMPLPKPYGGDAK